MPRASQTQVKEEGVSPAPLPQPTAKASNAKQIYLKRVALFAILVVVFAAVFQLLSPHSSSRSSVLGLGGSPAIALYERDDSFAFSMVPSAAPAPMMRFGMDGAMGMNVKSYGEEASIMPIPPVGDYPEASSVDLPAEKKIIKDGRLHLLVDDSEYVAQTIARTTAEMGGFVESTSFSNNVGDQGYGYMTVRIPSEHFDHMMATIKSFANRVESESSSAQDVSAQYIDLEAQLKNYRAEEEQYVEIMSDATKTEDVLMVASRLSEVRGRIERTQGQLNLLSRQTSMSTISITLQPVASASTESAAWRPRTVINEAFKDVVAGLIGFANLLLVMVVRLPLLLLQLAFFLVILWGLVRLGKWGMRHALGRSLPPSLG